MTVAWGDTVDTQLTFDPDHAGQEGNSGAAVGLSTFLTGEVNVLKGFSRMLVVVKH